MSNNNDKKTKFINAKRRGFLQGSVVAGGAVATGAAEASVTNPDEIVAPAKTAGHAGYKLTDKVKRYYERARY